MCKWYCVTVIRRKQTICGFWVGPEKHWSTSDCFGRCGVCWLMQKHITMYLFSKYVEISIYKYIYKSILNTNICFSSYIYTSIYTNTCHGHLCACAPLLHGNRFRFRVFIILLFGKHKWKPHQAEHKTKEY